MKRLMKVFPALGLLLVVGVLAGCGKDTVTSPSAATTEEAVTASRGGGSEVADDTFLGIFRGFSRVMVVHASPDAPAVDALLGYRKIARNLEFPDNSRYRWFLAGDRRVRVNVAGTDNSVIDERVPFKGWTNYSVFAVNEVSNIEPIVATDDLSRPARGNAHVRFAHLSPNAPAVDIAVAGGGAVFPNYVFKQISEFTPLPAGTYDLEVRLAGRDDVVLPLPGITLEDGVIYTVFARGFVDGTGDQALGAQIIVNRKARRAAQPQAVLQPIEGALADL